MDHIISLIENSNWNEALKLFLEYSEAGNALDDKSCIIGATIMEHFDNYSSMLTFIREGLKLNPSNYELYLLLGNYYSHTNPDQAYLAYENALYFCISTSGEKSEDTIFIRQTMDNLKSNHTISVRKVSFVILSFNNLEYTKGCITSIQQNCFSDCCEIVVVDNASTDGSVEWLRSQNDIILIENKENTGFPAGCNQGIIASDPSNDIFLLNNDTLMLRNSLFWLRIGLYKDDKTGAAGAMTNCAGNGQQFDVQLNSLEEYALFGEKINAPMINPYESKAFLIMFAMIIKRDVLDKVGLLDERFTPGNFEDNDYGMRLMDNGYDCILCHNSYIYHYGSKSFGTDIDRYVQLYVTNRDKFRSKWGFYGDYYSHARDDVISMISEGTDKAFSVLEIGCGLGGTLARIRYRFPQADVSGIEIEDKVAKLGGRRFDIKYGDIETIKLDERRYDYILFPDVLEHLHNPENVLCTIKHKLKKDGRIIASIPNIMNAPVIHDLLCGDFTYQDAGILDRTHLRFFTLNEIKRMFTHNGYNIEAIEAVVLPDESTNSYKDFFDRLLTIDGVAPRELFDAYQFIVKASSVD